MIMAMARFVRVRMVIRRVVRVPPPKRSAVGSDKLLSASFTLPQNISNTDSPDTDYSSWKSS